jgi:hypothetical protein
MDELALEEDSESLEDYDYSAAFSKELSVAYNLLLADLSVRSNNYHVGSWLGGNYTQLHHLLSRNVFFRVHPTLDKDLVIADDGSRLVFTFKCDFLEKKLDLRILRRALNDYCIPLNLPEVSFDQITDPKWWDAQNLNYKSVRLLVSYLKKFSGFWASFSPKVNLVDAFTNILWEEEKEIRAKYREEIGCPDINEEAYKGEDYPNLNGLIKSHPVYGTHLSRINKRQTKFINSLPSEKEKLFLQFSRALPAYVALLTLRKITIDIMVKMNLDNYINEHKELMEYKNPTEEVVEDK